MFMVKVLPLQRSLFLKKPMLWSKLATVIWTVLPATSEVNKRKSSLRLSEECMQYLGGGNDPQALFCLSTDIMFLHFRLKHGRNYLSRQSKFSESNPLQIWYRAVMIVFFFKRRYCWDIAFFLCWLISKLGDYFSWQWYWFFFRLVALWISLVVIVDWTTFR